MSKVIISAGQSLADVCLQTRGSLKGLFELADLNGLPITAALVPGQELELPSTPAPAADVVNYYAARAQRINSLNQTAAELPVGQLHDFISSDVLNPDFY